MPDKDLADLSDVAPDEADLKDIQEELKDSIWTWLKIGYAPMLPYMPCYPICPPGPCFSVFALGLAWGVRGYKAALVFPHFIFIVL